MRKIIKKFHLYLALILCLPLIIQSLSGSILVLRKQIAPQSKPLSAPVYNGAQSKSKAVSEEKNPRREFVRFFKKLHTNLFINNEYGRAAIGIYGLTMLFMTISGLILWWPKKRKIEARPHLQILINRKKISSRSP